MLSWLDEQRLPERVQRARAPSARRRGARLLTPRRADPRIRRPATFGRSAAPRGDRRRSHDRPRRPLANRQRHPHAAAAADFFVAAKRRRRPIAGDAGRPLADRARPARLTGRAIHLRAAATNAPAGIAALSQPASLGRRPRRRCDLAPARQPHPFPASPAHRSHPPPRPPRHHRPALSLAPDDRRGPVVPAHPTRPRSHPPRRLHPVPQRRRNPRRPAFAAPPTC